MAKSEPVIAIPNENSALEYRCAMTPAHIAQYGEKGFVVRVEAGLGAGMDVPDQAFADAGATVVKDRQSLWAGAAIHLRVQPPAPEEIASLPSGVIQISFLDPFSNPQMVHALASQGVTALSMQMVPRITKAQRMDALSSQASLGGYAAVVVAANQLRRAFPMMMTAAGTIQPAQVFVIGVGVAGLQAIATAKRLGARVSAFDTRPVVEEQVRSLGARFVKIDIGETGETAGGYAKELTSEQLEKQRQGMAKMCERSNVVITTAQVFGRPAPRLLTADMIQGMAPGSVVVDMAVDTGGNVEGVKLNEVVRTENDVALIGLSNLPKQVAAHASQVYATNLFNLLTSLWVTDAGEEAAKAAEGKLCLAGKDEVRDACVLTEGGKVIHPDLPKQQPAPAKKPAATKPVAVDAKPAAVAKGVKSKAEAAAPAKAPSASKPGKKAKSKK